MTRKHLAAIGLVIVCTPSLAGCPNVPAGGGNTGGNNNGGSLGSNSGVIFAATWS